MKQYELKFYREWYEALSELSTDDRAAAALALLEYVYDGKLPEDQFIRIVTTLMRNKIDREKAAHTARQSQPKDTQSPSSNSQSNNRHQPVNPGLRPVSESTDSLPQSSAAESSVVEPSGETSVPQQPKTNNQQVLITPEEAKKYGIPNPDPFNRILSTFYNPGSKELSSLAQQHNLKPHFVAECVKEVFIEGLRSNPACTIAEPSSFKRAKLDSLAIAKAHSIAKAS